MQSTLAEQYSERAIRDDLVNVSIHVQGVS